METILDNAISKEAPAWLKDRVIWFVRSGSHSYGTNIASSDEDFKGIAIVPRDYTLGFAKRFDQFEGSKPYDVTVYGIQKFMNLAANANPNILEVLYCDSVVFERYPMSKLLAVRDEFLSKKTLYTFSGYAMSQLKRIRLHRKWLLSPPDHKPERMEYGLPERHTVDPGKLDEAMAFVNKHIDSIEPDLSDDFTPSQRKQVMQIIENVVECLGVDANQKWAETAVALGIDSNFAAMLTREKAYRAAVNEWRSYQNWKLTRNPARAELEAKSGYDTKHAMHLVRLLRMGREILEGSGMIVRRPDYQELLEIRNGAWSYEKLEKYAADEELRMKEAAKITKLPHHADMEFLNNICVEMVMSF